MRTIPVSRIWTTCLMVATAVATASLASGGEDESAANTVFSVNRTSPTVSLDGTWHVTRTADQDKPRAGADWRPVVVPSTLRLDPDRSFAWYRRSFRVPREMAGKHLFLRFGAVRFVSDVYVNGRHVGGHYGGWEPFEMEISAACKPNAENELLVRVRDVRGVVKEQLDPDRLVPGERFVGLADGSIMAPVGSRYMELGIWEPVELLARNDLYVADVTVRTSVRDQRISVEAEIINLADGDREAKVAAEIERIELNFAERNVAVPAGGSTHVAWDVKWKNPKLWDLDKPNLYHLLLQVQEGGQAVATERTRFGFREFWIEGAKLVLNGTPINFLATAGHPRGQPQDELSKASAIDFYKRIRASGCVAMRLHANIWPKTWYEAADEVGMPLIMESALWCLSPNYALARPEFWKNYHDHLRASIRDKKNHPAIVMISLENEILHCGGDRVEGTEARLAEAGRLVKRLDPTRPIMYDADADPGGVADVVNLHYPINFERQNLWPNIAWWLEDGMEVAGWPRKFWSWDRNKPLYFGEFLWMFQPRGPDAYSILIGDEAYLGPRQALARCKARAWRMQIEAYRALGVSGLCPWTLTETGDFPSPDNLRYLAVRNSYRKIAAFVREYDARFYGGDSVERTVYLFNDTLESTELSLEWRLLNGGEAVGRGSRDFQAAPAQRFRVPVELKIPKVEARTPLQLQLRVVRDGKPVFEDTRQYWAFPRRPLQLPRNVRVAIFEPSSDMLHEALDAAGAEPLAVEDLSELPGPEQIDVLIVGPHALASLAVAGGVPEVGGGKRATQPLAAFVEAGGSVVVLEQRADPAGLLPVEIIDHACTIAFPRAPHSPILDRTEAEDLRFWREGHLVASNSYRKPDDGRFCTVVDCGGASGLEQALILETTTQQGRMILSQLAVGEKLGREPVAAIVLEHMIALAAEPVPKPRRLAIVQDELQLAEMMAELDLSFTNISGKLDSGCLEDFDIILAEADAAEVGQHSAALKYFVQRGGTVVLHRLSDVGASRLGGLMPEPVESQPSRAVPISIAERTALLDGLSNQELYWYGSREGLHWRVATPLSTDICHRVLVLGTPDPAQRRTIEVESMNPVYGDPTRRGNGYYCYASAALAGEIEIDQAGSYALSICGEGSSAAGVFPQIRLSVDGEPRGHVTIAGPGPHSATAVTELAAGKHRIELAFVNDFYDPARGEDRNVLLERVTFGPLPPLASRALLRPAALVETPHEKGRLLFDQIRWSAPEANSAKARRYIGTLLRNLGCGFGESLAAARLLGAELKPQGEISVYRTQDGAAHLGCNGTVAHRVRFSGSDQARYEFLVVTQGTAAAGEYPHLVLGIDGRSIETLKVEKPGWQTLRATAEVAPGVHEVSLTFTNDLWEPPEDRNVQIRSLLIREAAR